MQLEAVHSKTTCKVFLRYSIATIRNQTLSMCLLIVPSIVLNVSTAVQIVLHLIDCFQTLATFVGIFTQHRMAESAVLGILWIRFQIDWIKSFLTIKNRLSSTAKLEARELLCCADPKASGWLFVMSCMWPVACSGFSAAVIVHCPPTGFSGVGLEKCADSVCDT